MIGWRTAALALLAIAQAQAASAADSPLRGQFTFNWHTNPGRTKCTRVGDQLVSVFNSPKFHCDLDPQTNTASGVPATAVCSAADGKSEYLIFGTLAACENERKTQAANGD